MGFIEDEMCVGIMKLLRTCSLTQWYFKSIWRDLGVGNLALAVVMAAALSMKSGIGWPSWCWSSVKKLETVLSSSVV